LLPPGSWLDTLPTPQRDAFCTDLCAAATATRAGIVPPRALAADQHWALWTIFCRNIQVDPYLSNLDIEPIHLLWVFAIHYHNGSIAPRGRPVQSRTVENALRSVGQTLALLGTPDPRLTALGATDFRLARLLRGFHATDPAPNRVRPIPLKILHKAMELAATSPTAGALATADMACIAFFFLLRPGEYTAKANSTASFNLGDIQLLHNDQLLSWQDLPEQALLTANYVTYTFRTQKNGVRGEALGQGASGHQLCCPVRATIRRLLHHRQHGSPTHFPLATYYSAHHRHGVLSKDITAALRMATAIIGPSVGFTANDISAWSLRAGGAMALLCADVDPDIIRLLGRWKSDTMFQYLFVQARPLVNQFASRMLTQGDFDLLPGTSAAT